MKTILPTPEQLASKFSKFLLSEIGQEKLHIVISRNRGRRNRVCHSHDFCDANMVMDAAFKELAGISATDTAGGSDQRKSDSCMSDECLDLWTAAWLLAKQREFRFE